VGSAERRFDVFDVFEVFELLEAFEAIADTRRVGAFAAPFRGGRTLAIWRTLHGRCLI
jgi:hypothetical protein